MAVHQHDAAYWLTEGNGRKPYGITGRKGRKLKEKKEGRTYDAGDGI